MNYNNISFDLSLLKAKNEAAKIAYFFVINNALSKNLLSEE